MTQLFLAALGLPHSPPLPPRVHDLNLLRALPADTLPADTLPATWHALLDEEHLLRDWCTLNGIHWPRYQRAVGFTPRRHPASPPRHREPSADLDHRPRRNR